jgi:hypothetical protein
MRAALMSIDKFLTSPEFKWIETQRPYPQARTLRFLTSPEFKGIETQTVQQEEQTVQVFNKP